MIDKYNFQIGEEVIDTFGRKGKIIDVCKCEQCKQRGFYEPIIKMEHEDDKTWISNIQETKGFPFYHSIGNRIFNSYNQEKANEILEEWQEKLAVLQDNIYYLAQGIEFIEKEQLK